MRRLCLSVCLLLLLSAAGICQSSSSTCAECTEWNLPQTPFRIFGNSYYVGTHGLSSILITSQAGHVLIDGALPESAERIAANIQSLGFRVADVKIILNSHVHFDHAGGISKLQQLSGARVLASKWSAAVMKTGGVGRGDPQYGEVRGITPIKNVHKLKNGETFRLGTIAVTAHLTPGHTPGSTSWSWRSCEGDLCHDLVYADSLTPVSAAGFRFSEHPAVLADFEMSFAFLEALPCDILITPHPEVAELWDHLEMRQRGVMPDPMINSRACRQLAEQGRERLRQRLVEERAKRGNPSE